MTASRNGSGGNGTGSGPGSGSSSGPGKKGSSAKAEPKKVRCLVIQLAKLGDTLQTLMALRAAKQLYPQLEISLVTRERFAAAAKCVPWIAEVITLPTDRLVGPLKRGERDETESLGDLARE